MSEKVYVNVIDTERTCWPDREIGPAEIISIGIIKMHLGEIVDKYYTTIRPKINRKLSKYCTDLTKLTQEEVDQSLYFEQMFPRISEFLGGRNNLTVSWGRDDLCIIKQMGLSKIRQTYEWEFVNLSKVYQNIYGRKESLPNALLKYEIIPEGEQHHALWDAHNTALLYSKMLKRV